jgi:hypothetical protein
LPSVILLQQAERAFTAGAGRVERVVATAASASESSVRTQAMRRLHDENESMAGVSRLVNKIESAKFALRRLRQLQSVAMVPVWPIGELSVTNQLLMVLAIGLSIAASIQSRAAAVLARQREARASNDLQRETESLRIAPPTEGMRLRQTSSGYGGFSARLSTGVSPALSAESGGGATPRSPYLEL